MQASDDSVPGTAFIVLDEPDFPDQRIEFRQNQMRGESNSIDIREVIGILNMFNQELYPIRNLDLIPIQSFSGREVCLRRFLQMGEPDGTDETICREKREQVIAHMRPIIPEILELVDNSVLKDQEMLQIAMRPAVELSYLRKEEQADLFAIMDEMDCTPSHAQAIKMRQMSEAKTGDERLAKDALVSIMKEEKPNQKEQFKIPKEKISRFFAPGTPTQKIEDTIVKALELYRKRQRSLER